MAFTHFHLHSEYSLQDGMITIPSLMASLKKKSMNAVALTDRMNLFAAVKFYKAAIASGIKPILGCEIILRDSAEGQEFSAVCLCQNRIGYRHLTHMISRAYTENQDVRGPWVNYTWLASYSEGLIVLSGGQQGDIGQALIANNTALAGERLALWSNLFPNRFYLEIQHVGKPREEEYLEKVTDLAQQWDLPLIATNDVHFLETEDFEAHEARVCIYEGLTLEDSQRRQKKYTPEQYLRAPEEMLACFEAYPEAIENAIQLTKRCNVHLELGKTYLPRFPVPEGITVDAYLTQMAMEGLKERNDSFAESYYQRLTMELDVIHRMGFSGYFLIVADFIQWAKNNQIPVGPGRGSGAGSLVAYALKITDLDPIKHDLLFERFLNPERVSMPDFDIDFCVEGRDRVIDYVTKKYGRENVAQIITYGTMAAKAVVRDVGRVLGHPYGFVDSIAKLIPFELGMTLDIALEQEEILRKRYQEEEEVKELLDLARKLEGITRNVGKHAGGVVIASSSLTDFTPLYSEPDGSNRVTQFDKGDVEAVGLVKFDFLGLKTLTIIDRAVKSIPQKKIDITQIPIDDPTTFSLLKTSQTTALFQLESRGMRELVHRLQLDCFDDIMALVALYRPGPLQSGMVDDFIHRKQGKTPVVYPHPALENVLKPTYGVILYQEQVMQIAQVLAGYTLGGADILRSAMGKKKVEEMAKQRQIFTEGAVERGTELALAESIFDLMEKFAGYGFNKSHSAAYALVSYQTAWLKAHYPAEFMAAVLSADLDNTDKLKGFIEECAAMNLVVRSPDIEKSEYYFIVNAQGEIIYGLGAIKGVGKAAVDLILAERKKNGPYKNLFDFCQRLDLRKITRRVLEALIGAGAFDVWQVNRGILFSNVDKAVKQAETAKNHALQGQHDFFHLLDNQREEAVYDEAISWNTKTYLQVEQEKLGFYMTGHPFDMYREECRYFSATPIGELNPQVSSVVTVGGLVVDLRKILTKKGKKMAVLTLDDGVGKIEIAIFSEQLEASQHILGKGEILIVQGEISVDTYSDSLRMRAAKLINLPMARELYGKRILLTVDSSKINEDNLNLCQSLLKQYSTGCMPVRMVYQQDTTSIAVDLGQEFQIYPEDELMESLNLISGVHAAVQYAAPL